MCDMVRRCDRRLSYEQGCGCEPSAPTNSSFRLSNLAWLCVCLSRLEELGHSIETSYALSQGVDIRNIHNIPFAQHQTLGNHGGYVGFYVECSAS